LNGEALQDADIIFYFYTIMAYCKVIRQFKSNGYPWATSNARPA